MKLNLKERKEQTRGITLIALIITIIILLILAGIAIGALGENGLFGKAQSSKEKTEFSEAKEKLELKIAELLIGKEENIGELTKEDLLMLNDEEINVESTEKFPVEIIIYGKYKFNIDNNFTVTYIGKTNGTIVTYTADPKGYTNQDNIILRIKISNLKGIKKVQYPNDDITNYNGETNIVINYTVQKNGTYTFKITDYENNEVIKNIMINQIDKLKPIDFTPTISDITNNGFKITINTSDAEDDGINAKSGIEKYEYYIKKSGETEYTKYESKENTITVNNLASATEYSIYAIVYDKAGNSTSSFNKTSELIVKTNISLENINDPINIQDGLVSYWPLQDNFINYANPGKNDLVDVNGTAVFEEGAIHLESDCLITSDKYQLEGNQTTFLQYKRTFETAKNWLQFFGYNTDRDRYCYYDNGLVYDSYQKKVCLIAYSNYSSHISFDLDEVLPLNTWVNIVVTTNNEGTTVYFNNLKLGNTTSYKYDSSSYKLVVGGNSNILKRCANGYYKNFGIFNRALSDEEVQRLFN